MCYIVFTTKIETEEKKEKEKRTERTVDQTAAEKTEKEKRTERTIDQTAAEKTEKEKEEVTEKEEKKFNMHLAQLFFKRMMDAQRTRKTGNKKRDQVRYFRILDIINRNIPESGSNA